MPCRSRSRPRRRGSWSRASGRWPAATERLRAGEQARLAVVRIWERNRAARDLHDVVAHGVSVMVVQAGAARITLGGEPDLASAALAEVSAAGRTGLSELRRILGVIGAEDHDNLEPAHVARLLTKLGLRDRVQAVVFAYQHGVVPAGPLIRQPRPIRSRRHPS